MCLSLLLFLLSSSLHPTLPLTRTSPYTRSALSPSSSCYFQPYYKQLTCMCGPGDTFNYISIKMEYFVRELGQEVG